MSTVRIALANVSVPATQQESVLSAKSAIAEAGRQGALVVCFPECFIPGYRWPGTTASPPDPAFLERAWSVVAHAAKLAGDYAAEQVRGGRGFRKLIRCHPLPTRCSIAGLREAQNPYALWTARAGVPDSSIGEVRHREASNPVAAERSRSATSKPDWPYG